MSGPGVLIQNGFLVDRLGPFGEECRVYTPADMAGGISSTLAEEVEVLVTAGEIPNTLVDALPKLRLVACFSTGYAGIDLPHLRARDIRLTTAAGVNAHDVADHAIALMLALWHGIPAADQVVRSGGWRNGVAARPSLRGRSAGVLGLGRIGSAIASRLVAHELIVRWWGPRDKPDAGFERVANVEELASQSDILIVASRAVPDNAGQVDAAVLRALGPQGIAINVSRGFLIDEPALITALRDGKIAGAALDVFDPEPLDLARWRDVPNVVLTPHLAGYTIEAGADMVGQLRENVERYLRGEALLSPVEDALQVWWPATLAGKDIRSYCQAGQDGGSAGPSSARHDIRSAGE